jgi:hypothetical protein
MNSRRSTPLQVVRVLRLLFLAAFGRPIRFFDLSLIVVSDRTSPPLGQEHFVNP